MKQRCQVSEGVFREIKDPQTSQLHQRLWQNREVIFSQVQRGDVLELVDVRRERAPNQAAAEIEGVRLGDIHKPNLSRKSPKVGPQQRLSNLQT